MSKEAMKQALEALEYTTNLSRFLLNDEANIGPMLKADEAITSLRQAIAEAEKQEQGIDWKDMYEKEKRRSAMWSARYERDIGPLERATPQQEQSVSVSNPIGEFPKTILAVIKEVANRNPKNGLDRWTDYETGAYMQDDADAALLWIKNKAKQEQSAEHVGEPVADPFADIHDKRIGELTAEQQDRAVEFWLRNQKGWLSMSEREHVEALLRVIDNLRTTPYVPTGRQQRPFIKPLTDEQIEREWQFLHDEEGNPPDHHDFARSILTSATDFKE